MMKNDTEAYLTDRESILKMYYRKMSFLICRKTNSANNYLSSCLIEMVKYQQEKIGVYYSPFNTDFRFFYRYYTNESTCPPTSNTYLVLKF